MTGAKMGGVVNLAAAALDNLQGADLNGCDLRGCNLRGINLKDAKMRGVVNLAAAHPGPGAAVSVEGV